MAPRPQKSTSGTPGGSGTPGPDEGPQISPGGTYGLEDVIVGCKAFVQKPDVVTGEMEERQAEILSIREKPKPRLTKKQQAELANMPAPTLEEKLEYYVHYCEFNKRLDEWVSGTRLITSRDLEWPKKDAPNDKTKRKVVRTTSGTSTPSTPLTPTGKGNRGAGATNLLKKAAAQAAKNAHGDTGDISAAQSARADSVDADADADDEDGAVVAMEMIGGADQNDQDDVATESNGGLTASLNANQPQDTFSKKQEIEKLRTSGSMTQSVSEVARVKNLNKIQMGKALLSPWYFTAIPVEYAHIDTLYICEMCLSFFPSSFTLKRHRIKCELLHPPGLEVYRSCEISFFEIDGRKQRTWCRNLCLLSKCFLDHKTLYYDVDPFLFYCMVKRDDTGCHLLGYFSKEKDSAENYNVACILTLPQHQRHGYGKLLIEFSYELSKIEKKLGSPEKPLSDLGLLSYRAYWAEIIVELLLKTEEDISIEEIAQKTAFTHADVLHTLTALNMVKSYAGKHMLVLSDAVIAKYAKKKPRVRINPDKIIWSPPVYSRVALQFGW
ncbi:probable ESA1-histone acetyltransferase [Sporisorium reilianum SRZ2]|uniref:histone acetyltransferase n=2 Tax=Sporisorium reilianum TaxID=72558 RepID=E6ZYY7_SPORE|nr:probable ESA1-histone acetyltransferase [Sporisorium reilianum SRZ2]SJX62306.1 probable ESA1-histone acetyltransferase [Sporisorium reilianum f. sp. reilianum]